MRWTAFDQETAEALAARLPNVEHAQGSTDALASALSLTRDPAINSAAAVLAPARDNGQTLVITMRTKAAAQPGSTADVPAPEPSEYEAGGFLGLSDEPVYEKKKR
jgi:hypothetical protein